MTHTYQVDGMTCTGCSNKVQKTLAALPEVSQVIVDLENKQATITMATHIPVQKLQQALGSDSKYRIREQENNVEERPVSEDHRQHTPTVPVMEQGDDAAVGKASWFDTYRPVLLIGFYLVVATLLIEWRAGSFSADRWMMHFMGGFFLVFSFFKLLDVKSFAESYSTYDLLAKRWMGWGYVYPFVELGLGLAFISGVYPLIVSWVALLVMSVSIIGVLQTVMNKRRIRCACLGTVFNLPMSTVTIIEDGSMIAMSVLMIANII